jgi:D-alanyl-lipoteichoic acid acyltransferase DltB (MBOAT superfamily)
MQFTSLEFAIFLPVVFLVYWAVPNKYRMPLLLLVSYGFYMTFSPGYVILLIALSALTYLTGRYCSKRNFIASVIVQVCLLIFFKYVGLIPQIAESIVIPVGISFYIFKAISYMADVYTGKLEPEKAVLPFFLYLAFFPDIVSGPINRAECLIPQLKKEKQFDYDEAAYGMRLILWGLFKKLLIADTLARYVDQVFAVPDSYMGISCFFAAVFYTIEIYCDFSGYSDMAIGIARLLGVHSMENFKSPYLAANIKEFWDRWHISLSTWLRDYIYIPLGGNRKGNIKTYFNLLATFLISGIWHGANLTFLVWGALHGVYQGLYRLCKKHCKKSVPKILGIVITFSLVALAWIFFRADSLRDACFMIRYLGYNLNPLLAYHKMGMNKQDFVLILGSVTLLGIYDAASLKQDVLGEMKNWKTPIRWAVYLVMAVVIVSFHLHNGTSQQFIYFQF